MKNLKWDRSEHCVCLKDARVLNKWKIKNDLKAVVTVSAAGIIPNTEIPKVMTSILNAGAEIVPGIQVASIIFIRDSNRCVINNTETLSGNIMLSELCPNLNY